MKCPFHYPYTTKADVWGFLCTYLITPDCLLISFHAYLSLLIFTVCLSLYISSATLYKHGIISCIEKANQNISLTALLF